MQFLGFYNMFPENLQNSGWDNGALIRFEAHRKTRALIRKVTNPGFFVHSLFQRSENRIYRAQNALETS